MAYRHRFDGALLASSVVLMGCACVALAGRWRAVLGIPPLVVAQAVMIGLSSGWFLEHYFAPGSIAACVAVACAWVGSRVRARGREHPGLARADAAYSFIVLAGYAAVLARLGRDNSTLGGF